MRAIFPLAMFLLVGCSQEQARRDPTPVGSRHPALTQGEERAHIASRDGGPAILRSGPNVPVTLPRGFTIYPGATVVSNTVVHRGGGKRALVVFETPDPVAKVILHYRAEARLAGAAIALDLGGEERASLGGTIPDGASVTISARRARSVTRVEFAYG